MAPDSVTVAIEARHQAIADHPDPQAKATLATCLQNVLNERYEEVFGFSSPRITALTGLEVRY